MEPDYNEEKAVEMLEKVIWDYVILISEYIFVVFCMCVVERQMNEWTPGEL